MLSGDATTRKPGIGSGWLSCSFNCRNLACLRGFFRYSYSCMYDFSSFNLRNLLVPSIKSGNTSKRLHDESQKSSCLAEELVKVQ